MAIFKYQGTNIHGNRVRGKVVALNQGDAERRLSNRGFRVEKLFNVSGGLESRLAFIYQRVKSRDLVVFSRQFSLLVSSDIGVVDALMTIVEQTENPRFQSIITDVAFEVNGGSLLSEALRRKGEKIFSNFYVNVVAAGETSGKLDEVLSYLADEMEKDYDLVSKFKSAMIYPAVVLCGLGGVGFIMMYFVLPNLTAILEETGATLPWATQVVIGAVNFFQNYIWLIILLIILAIFSFRALMKTDAGRLRIDSLKLRLPIVGKMYKLIYLIRFCRSFGTLLKGGVTIIRSLEVSGEVVRNRLYQKLIQKTMKAVSEGDSVSAVFLTSSYVPRMIPQMMSIGERTGHLDSVLEKISQFYSRELAEKLNNLGAVLEPVVMIILGIGVAIMVAAVILPMYNIATSF
ncbi:MAG TPA: type II secretion system F family protein [bacterium]|nr:type II secretion system F family protein [bacterium]HPT29803.1 type II secretion system F family protein [bacterium]